MLNRKQNKSYCEASAHIVESSVTIKNSPIQDCIRPNDHIPPAYYRLSTPFKEDTVGTLN